MAGYKQYYEVVKLQQTADSSRHSKNSVLSEDLKPDVNDPFLAATVKEEKPAYLTSVAKHMVSVAPQATVSKPASSTVPGVDFHSSFVSFLKND